MSRGYVTLAILAAVMSALTVVRHTRQNEETGRAELLGAGVVGRSPRAWPPPSSSRSARTLVLAPLLGLAMIVNGQPVGGFVRRRRGDRRRGRRVHRRRRA